MLGHRFVTSKIRRGPVAASGEPGKGEKGIDGMGMASWWVRVDNLPGESSKILKEAKSDSEKMDGPSISPWNNLKQTNSLLESTLLEKASLFLTLEG